MREVWHRVIPSRTIPRTRWRSEGSRWRSGPRTFVVLILGLWLFGTGEAMLVDATLGNAPWTVFAQGISVRTGIAIGLATFFTSVVVLLMWIPLRERPGLGTIANAIVIALALQVMIGLCLIWGVQQVMIKWAAADIAPVMQAAGRSGISALLVGLFHDWLRDPNLFDPLSDTEPMVDACFRGLIRDWPSAALENQAKPTP